MFPSPQYKFSQNLLDNSPFWHNIISAGGGDASNVWSRAADTSRTVGNVLKGGEQAAKTTALTDQMRDG